MVESLKQPQYAPMTVAEMALVMFAVGRGLLDDVPLKKVVDFEAALLDYVRAQEAQWMASLNANPVLSKDVEARMMSVISDFKKGHVA